MQKLSLVALILATTTTLQLHSAAPTSDLTIHPSIQSDNQVHCDFKPSLCPNRIESEYKNNLKDLFKTLKSDNVNNQERNSLVDQMIISLESNTQEESPDHYKNLFEKNVSLFSKEEIDAFLSQYLNIAKQTEQKHKQALNDFTNKENCSIN